MNIDSVHLKYEELVSKLINKNLSIATMESCTGGFIASLITDNEGSSEIFEEGFVTYSNKAKILQGVPEDVIFDCGVYSPETAKYMAMVVKNTVGANIGIGITGTFANEDPNNSDSVSNTVYACVYINDQELIRQIDTSKCLNRFDAKISVADTVADMLNELI